MMRFDRSRQDALELEHGTTRSPLNTAEILGRCLDAAAAAASATTALQPGWIG